MQESGSDPCGEGNMWFWPVKNQKEPYSDENPGSRVEHK